MSTPGILLIDKPAGISSARVVSVVKKRLNLKKVGHAGTLDPAATGLLVCLLGKATRLASYAEGGGKIYSGLIKLGVITSTDDLDGETLEEREVDTTDEAIQQAVADLTGEIEQVPPAISAVKVNGKRAYALARAGEEVTLKKRAVTVGEFEVSRVDETTLKYRVACSKGTYIRSLARDIGETLGCGAAVQTLRREASEPFSVEQAIALDDADSTHVIPWPILLPSAQSLMVPDTIAKALSMGDERAFAQIPPPEASSDYPLPLFLYQAEGSELPAGILRWQEDQWKIVLNLPADPQ